LVPGLNFSLLDKALNAVSWYKSLESSEFLVRLNANECNTAERALSLVLNSNVDIIGNFRMLIFV